MSINYVEEVESLTNGFWEPPEGETVVKATGELSDRTEVTFEDESGQPEVQERVDLPIEVQGQKVTWRISPSQSKRSLSGQLVGLAADGDGLAGRQLKVTRVGSGRATQYTVTGA